MMRTLVSVSLSIQQLRLRHKPTRVLRATCHCGRVSLLTPAVPPEHPPSGSRPGHAAPRGALCIPHCCVQLQLVRKVLQPPIRILLQMHSHGLSICKRHGTAICLTVLEMRYHSSWVKDGLQSCLCPSPATGHRFT